MLRRAALLTGSGCASALLLAPGASLAAPGPLKPLSRTRSTTEPYVACPPASAGRAGCYAVVDPPARSLSSVTPFAAPATSGVAGSGLSPAELQSAYKLPSSTGGGGQTVAIVDAYDDPKAESDLASYRSAYGLPACTEQNGCFRKVNQSGGKSYPPVETGWNVEESLDFDMVSAICPNCHILLVEASSNGFGDLAAAEDEAASLGATEISNSWGAPESSGDASMDSAFHHPGIPVTVASGDYGYDNHEMGASTPSYPASSPEVIAVGGTMMAPATNARGWSESVWPRSGSGCSSYETKPSFQSDSGCARRTTNDVAAVAEDLSIYDTSGESGWFPVGGTSAATPIIAAVEALSEAGERSRGAKGLYESKSSLFRIASGSDGSCSPAYLCTALSGYNGPAGNGTPDGALALTAPPPPPAPTLTSFTPAAGAVGTTVTITGTNLSGATTVAFKEAAASYKVESATKILATVPAGASTGPISVTTPGGTARSSSSFTVSPPAPTVSSIAPPEGPTGGGTVITITGAHYLTGASVKVGGKLATMVTVRSETEITAKTPEKEAGSYEVTVSDSSGTSKEGARFTYVAPPLPSVSAVSPAQGTTRGGTSITITGAHFLAGSSVRIGAKNVPGVTVHSETEITARTPEKEAGTYEVTVTDSNGTSKAGPKFTYVAPPPPAITSISPAEGTTAGHTLITIKGARFLPGASVKIGGKFTTMVTVHSETEITAKTPEKEAGSYEVVVSDSDGTSKGGPKFTYSAIVAVTSTASISMSCTAAKPCSGTATFTGAGAAAASVAAGPAHGVTLGSASYWIRAGGSAVVHVPLNAAGRSMLSSAHGQLGATLQIAGHSLRPGSKPIEVVRVKLDRTATAPVRPRRGTGPQVAIRT